MRKKIKCKFLGTTDETIELLKARYEIEESETPEYAFFSCTYLNDAYKYDCIRIVEMGENQRPNFNLFDYAYGFDRDLVFGDRYLYYPLYATKQYRNELELALHKHNFDAEFFLKREKFCNMVVSNLTSASDERIAFFELLSKYKKVDSGGRILNNLPNKRPIENKLEFQKNYKFSMAFENSTYPGYTTEKIIQAWAAGTIPIYWGDPTIAEQFNSKAFINCHEYDSWEKVVERIKEIDENDNLYMEMQMTPICQENSRIYDLIANNYYKEWLYNIIDQDWDKAYKRINSHVGWGYYVEKDLKNFCQLLDSPLVKVAYGISKKIGVNSKKNKHV